MSTFNPHHLARQIPAGTWQSYLAVRAITAEDFDWGLEPKSLANALAALLDGLERTQQAPIYAELRRVHAMATLRGVDALKNASPDDANLEASFAGLSNHAERALWTLVHWPDTFRAAEALLDFDRSAEKRSWKRHAIKVTDLMNRDPAALENLRQALSETFSRRKKRTRHCRIDVCDRFLDGGVQVSIYLEDDPNDPLEFDDTGAMHRRASRPTIHMALVYYADDGIVETVCRGGDKTHRPLIVLFARHLLGREVKPEAVQRSMYHLNRLRRGLDLPEDSDIDLAALGIERIRLRCAKLRSTEGPDCTWTVAVPANQPDASVFWASRAQLQERDLFRGPFSIIEALIDVIFVPREPGKRRRPMKIDLNQSGFSNLRDLDEEDACLADRLLRAWRVVEPTAPALPVAA